MQLRPLHTGSGLAEQDGGLIGAEEKVINSKNKVDENMVSHFSLSPALFSFGKRMRASSLVSGAFQEVGGRAPLLPQVPVLLSVWDEELILNSSSFLAMQWEIYLQLKS